MNPDQIGLIVGAVLTFCVLTYIIGDNFLFRLAVNVLIGAGAAYVTAIVILDVLIPRLSEPLASRNVPLIIVALAGLILGLMLWFKASPRLAWIGNLPVGYLLGVGVATVLGGAVLGTLGPQIVATGAPVTTPSGDPLMTGSTPLTIIVMIGTIVTLLSFGYYRASRAQWEILNAAGRSFFLMAALGATFALIFMASVTLLFERLYALYTAATIFVK
jgi:hypothetical protein